jgi:hypothetical protein
MSAPIPPMDPPPLRTMGDMGMAKMAGMEKGQHAGHGKARLKNRDIRG